MLQLMDSPVISDEGRDRERIIPAETLELLAGTKREKGKNGWKKKVRLLEFYRTGQQEQSYPAANMF